MDQSGPVICICNKHHWVPRAAGWAAGGWLSWKGPLLPRSLCSLMRKGQIVRIKCLAKKRLALSKGQIIKAQ